MLKLFQEVLIHKQRFKLFHIGKDRVHCFMSTDGGGNLELRFDEVRQLRFDGDLLELHRDPPHTALHKPKPKLKKRPSRKSRSDKRRAK